MYTNDGGDFSHLDRTRSEQNLGLNILLEEFDKVRSFVLLLLGPGVGRVHRC